MGIGTLWSDHFPFFSFLSKFARVLLVERDEAVRKFNFQKADWVKFREKLSVSLGDIVREDST